MQPYPNPNYFMQYQQPQYQQPNPYMQRMEQLQQFQQSLQSQNQSPALNTLATIGKYVESIDIVKATDIPMDGNMYFFPKADGTEIYGKAWMQDGRTRILTFKPVLEDEPDNSTPEEEKLKFNAFNAILEGIQADIKTLTDKVDKISKPTRAKKEVAEAEYYSKISKAMDEAEYGEDYNYKGAYDTERRGYRGQRRDSRGRYMSSRRMGYEEPHIMTTDMYHDYTPEMLRDMDREIGRMYYSGSGSQVGMNGGQSSRSENARRGYEESKMMQDGSPESKKKAMESLENYLKELSEDMTDLVGKMDANEKSMVRSKLQTLAQRVQ